MEYPLPNLNLLPGLIVITPLSVGKFHTQRRPKEGKPNWRANLAQAKAA
jgi:hypothetical protein